MTDFAGLRTKMVDGQVRPNDVTDHRIIDAMLSVAREDYVPAAQRDLAYLDRNIPVGNGRVILQPMLVARMLQTAEIKAGDTLLEIGTGLGYTAAVAARLAASVVALESDTALAAAATVALKSSPNVMVICAALTAIAADSADVILISGAVEVLPDAVKAGLKEGGRLVVIEGVGQSARGMLYTRAGTSVTGRVFMNAAAPVLPGYQREPVFAL